MNDNKMLHRPDTSERKHYSGVKPSSFRMRPRLLYAGSLDNRTQWSELSHSHNFCEIIFITGGGGKINIGGNDYTAEKGDIAIYNPGVPHFEKSVPGRLLQLSFLAVNRFELAGLAPDTLPTGEKPVVFGTDEHAAEFESLFKRLIGELRTPKPFCGEIINNITQTILFYILRIIQQKEKDGLPLYGSSILKQALGYIESCFVEQITLDDVAERCFVSKYHLSHLFKSSLGISIGGYIRSLRLNKAKKLLSETEKTVSEISLECGFGEPNYFCRIFKKETSLTPSEFRRSFSEAFAVKKPLKYHSDT